MRKIRRTICALLSCVLIAGTLSGCGYELPLPRIPVLYDRMQAEKRISLSGREPASLPLVWHADITYSEAEDLLSAPVDIQALAEPLFAIAKNGGTPEEFGEAEQALRESVLDLYTKYIIAEVSYDRDPSDEAAADADDIAYSGFTAGSDLYWEAMHAVSVSASSHLLDDSFEDWQIRQFAEYTAHSEEADRLAGREGKLLKEYYLLAADPSPDTRKIGETYAQLVNVRRQIAQEAGYDSYADYCYDLFYNREYTPESAEHIWNLTKKYFVPIVRKYAGAVGEAAAEAGWMGDIDCSEEAIFSAMEKVLPRISPDLSYVFDYMRLYGLFDLSDESRRMDTGYTTLLYSCNEPFIFVKLDGSYYDYSTMFHEFGHFTNYWSNTSDLIFGFPDNDMAEVQSQSLELLATTFYPELFGEEYGRAVADDLVMNIIYSVVDGAMYDEFQQKVFAEEGDLTPRRLSEIYTGLQREYGYDEGDSGNYWMFVEHNFSQPFYYISYAVSALPALELLAISEEDFAEAADIFMKAVAVDNEYYYFSEGVEKAGFSDPFDENNAAGIAASLEEYFESAVGTLTSAA